MGSSELAKKTCRACVVEKPLTEFYKAGGVCKTCSKLHVRDYLRRHPVKALLYHARDRAKALGREFSLVEEDIVIPDRCPVLGIPIGKALGKSSESSPTIDRVDTSRGYTKDNICVISWRANRLKSDATAAELRALAAYAETI